MNVITGMIWSHDWSYASPFFDSLRATGSSARVVVFAGNMSGNPPEEIDIIPFVPDKNPLLNLCHRFSYWFDYVEKHPEIERIMLTDITDVFFLGDPFSFDWPNGICFFLEDSAKPIGSCQFNGYWVLKLWGREIFNRIAHRPISCAGVTIGQRHSIREYLRAMKNKLRDVDMNLDQGAHNGLLWLDVFADAIVYPNRCGPVLTMGHMKKVELTNFDGSKPLIVHQYNRHVDAIKELLK